MGHLDRRGVTSVRIEARRAHQPAVQAVVSAGGGCFERGGCTARQRTTGACVAPFLRHRGVPAHGGLLGGHDPGVVRRRFGCAPATGTGTGTGRLQRADPAPEHDRPPPLQRGHPVGQRVPRCQCLAQRDHGRVRAHGRRGGSPGDLGVQPDPLRVDRQLEHRHRPRRHLRLAERRLLRQRRERDQPRPDHRGLQRHAAQRRLGRGGLADRRPPRRPDHAHAARPRRREPRPTPASPGHSARSIIRDLQPGPGYWWLDDTTGQKTLVVRRPGAG